MVKEVPRENRLGPREVYCNTPDLRIGRAVINECMIEHVAVSIGFFGILSLQLKIGGHRAP